MELRHFLDDLQVEQPNGIDDLMINIVRGKESHGLMYEASASNLIFTGVGANYLRISEQEKGQKAEVVYRCEFRCESDDEWDELLSGRVNFAKYSATYGNECSISVPIEKSSCANMIETLYEQKVDLDAAVCFDKITPLQPYDKLNMSLVVPALKMKASIEGSVAADGDTIDLSIFTSNTEQFSVRPTYADIKYESINSSQLQPSVFAASDNGVNDSVISPVMLMDDNANCYQGEFNYEARLKGNYDFSWPAAIGNIEYVRLIISKGEYPDRLDVLHQASLTFTDNTANGNFDYTYAGSVGIAQGDGFYTYLEAKYFGIAPILTGSITFDKETSINIFTDKQCQPSTARMYAVNESLSRIVESITNNCLRVRSDYYGRTDSQPYASSTDGCGSLRAINSGLQLRNAANAKAFVSLKDILGDGLNPIDNIGFGVEPDISRPGFNQLRIEDISYFYRNEEILRLKAVPSAIESIDETRYYSTISAGYEKWEVESVNGLDEVHSPRQFRIGLTGIKNPLNIQSKLVAGSKPIEITRQQSFASSGAADTKYDNELFIYCLKRNGSDFEIEQGGVDNAENIYASETIFNWRIRPIANLMRWFKTIGSAFTNVYNSDSKLYFMDGKGNYTAKGFQSDENCRMEAAPISENTDLRAGDFSNLAKAIPLWQPKPIKCNSYPLSVSEYKLIRSKPYGYITLEFSDGSTLSGYIDNIQYRPIKGEANFTLRKLWQ